MALAFGCLCADRVQLTRQGFAVSCFFLAVVEGDFTGSQSFTENQLSSRQWGSGDSISAWSPDCIFARIEVDRDQYLNSGLFPKLGETPGRKDTQPTSVLSYKATVYSFSQFTASRPELLFIDGPLYTV